MDLANIFVGHVAEPEDSSSEESVAEFLTSSSSESDASSDEDDPQNADILFPIFQILLNGRPRIRVLNFVETALAKGDTQFRGDFRVTRQTFDVLLNQLELSGRIPDHEEGRPKKSACLSLLMTLWFLSNRCASHRDLGNLFDISESSVHRIVRRVVGWLLTLMPQWIVWPRGNEAQRISQAFEEKAEIAGCIGAIDGSHIPIIKPVVDGRTYYNRKQSYSLVLQGVVDSDLKFTNIYCGDPGSFHDTRVLRRSDLYHQVERDVAAAFPNDTFLLGDKGYIGVGTRWIVTPFRDNGNFVPEQVDFNTRVSSTRVVVEQAFGILKARFRRLKMMEMRDLRFMVEVVMASCVLHNICRSMGDGGADFLDDNDDDANGPGDVNHGDNDGVNENGREGDVNEENDGADDTDDNDSYDENDEDQLVPGVEPIQPRQMTLFRQMYPNAVLPPRLRRQR